MSDENDKNGGEVDVPNRPLYEDFRKNEVLENPTPAPSTPPPPPSDSDE